MLSSKQSESAILTTFFKAIIHIYKNNHGNISRFSVANMFNLPMLLADRIFYSILEAKPSSNSIHKMLFMDNLIKFYLGNNTYKYSKILAFLDKENEGVIYKEDVKLLITYFQTFLKGRAVPLERINIMIAAVFQENETVDYKTDITKFYDEPQNIDLIHLFNHFLLKVTPLDEYPKYLKFDKNNTKGNIRGGTRAATSAFSPLSLQCQSYLKKFLNYDDEEKENKCKPELIFHDSDNEDSSNDGIDPSEYIMLGVQRSDDDDSPLDIPMSGFRVQRKKMSYEPIIPSTHTISPDEETKEFSKSLSSLDSIFSKKEYTFSCQEEDGQKEYKFFANENYIYYSYEKGKKVAIPIILSYINDIKPTMIKSKKYFQGTLICFYLFQNITIDLYSKTKEDLESFQKELKTFSHYKPLDQFYDIIEEVGKGNFSTVYLAIDKITNKKVAIKSIEKKTFYHPNQIEMIQNELDIFRFLCKNSHKNITEGIEYIESMDYLYFIYEYVPNKLPELKETKESSEQLICYIKEILSGLTFLHSNGIIHRDIKPDNILLDDNQSIKLIDLGLGTITTPSNSLLHPCGTLLFTAPEILSGMPYGNKCDIWSLGIVAYYCYYGFNPFKGASNQEIASNIIKGIYTFPTTTNNDTSLSPIEILIKRCLIVDQDSRVDLTEIANMLSSY